MKKTVARVVALDMIFLLFILLLSVFSGVLSDILYFCAYLVPIGAFVWLVRGENRANISLGIKGKDAAMCLPLVAPTIGVMIGLSALVSLLLSLAGVRSAEPLTGSAFELITLHALVPAVLEEALFRFVPLTLIAPYSRKSAVFISAILFAVAHCNVAQIPYAFVAGLIFAVIDIACESVLPSVVIHLFNNVASVFWLWDSAAGSFRLPFVISVAVLSLLSVATVLIFRARYVKKVSFLQNRDDKISTVKEVWVFAFVCLMLAVGALL